MTTMRSGLVLMAGVSFLMAGCSGVNNSNGMASRYIDPATSGPVQGVGIESQDIIAVTDQMMRDMLTEPRLGGAAVRPQVIIDSEYFHNDSSTRINKDIITDRLRVNLNRSARGRMMFVGRHYAGMVEHERDLKRAGVTTKGTLQTTSGTAGADYRLGGRITSHDAIDARSGMTARYSQIIFEMVDLETSEIVWSGIYEFAKAGQDDVVYR